MGCLWLLLYLQCTRHHIHVQDKTIREEVAVVDKPINIVKGFYQTNVYPIPT